MKEIFTISTGVNVAKAKSNVKNSKEVLSGNDKAPAKDFLSVMFAQIKESIKISEGDSKLSLDSDSSLEDTKTDLNTKDKEKSLDNHLLEDLLKVISLLKDPNAKISSFPSSSNKLTKLINSETALKDLKDVNNITDLLKLSKKYDLGLEKISVKKMDRENLEKEFPALAKKEFFVPLKEKSVKGIFEPKKEVEIKPTVLSLKNIEKPKIEPKKEPTLFEKIMSSPNEEQKKTKEIVGKKIVEEQKENIAIKTNEEVKKTIKVVKDEIPKVVVKEEQKEIKTKVVKDEIPKVVVKEEQKEIKTKVVKDEISKVVVKEEQKEIKTKVVKDELHVKVKKEVKAPGITRVTEPKIEVNLPKKGMIENILQGIKIDKQTNTTSTVVVENLNKETKTTESNEIKTDTTINRSDLKPQIKTDTLASRQLNPTKDTFNNFAADFKEKLENYKPPFMRVQLALNPKGLGEVDVVIVNRGNNLHVNISSNANTMSLFTQNQAEFKNSLVNMGFTNLEMNFSDQREKQEQQNSKQTKESGEFFEEETLEEETTSIELIVPQYI